MSPCLLIVANLCFHDVSNISISAPGGLTTTIDARGADYSMTIEVGGDNIRTPDWSRMQLACAAGACVAYYKRCEEPTLQRMACEYHFSQPGESQNTVVRLSASRLEAFTHATSVVSVLTRNGVDLIEVPFKAFSVEGPDKTPPYCDRHAPQTKCWPHQ